MIFIPSEILHFLLLVTAFKVKKPPLMIPTKPCLLQKLVEHSFDKPVRFIKLKTLITQN